MTRDAGAKRVTPFHFGRAKTRGDLIAMILVWHDVLGLTDGHVPQFVKRYAELGSAAQSALAAYVADVRGRKFPEPRHAYEMAEGEDFT